MNEPMPVSIAETTQQIAEQDRIIEQAVRRRMSLRLHLRKLEKLKQQGITQLRDGGVTITIMKG